MKRFFVFLLAGTILSAGLTAEVQTLEVPSASMDKTIPAAVVLPDSYDANDLAYPVLYLLHPAFGDYRSWLDNLPVRGVVQSLADQYNIIFVLPEGGAFSFYLDSPWYSGNKYETHIIKELIPFVDQHYRSVNNSTGRAIVGSSMGGYGALYLATRHPDLFGAAGSMSGVANMDIAGWELPRENIERVLHGIVQSMGGMHLAPDFLSENSLINMVDQMKQNQIPMMIDCGVDDFLIEANRTLHKKLLEYDVPHHYIEHPGRHKWYYWKNALLYQVMFISEVFKNNGSGI